MTSRSNLFGMHPRTHARISAEADKRMRERASEWVAAKDAEWEQLKAAKREADKADGTFTADELKDAIMVRDRLGWWPLSKVNRATVVVATRDGPKAIRINDVKEWR